MGNIHLIGGEKGGVGKSLVSRLLAQYFIDHSIPFLGFDTDRSHGALLRFYEGYASPVLIDSYESLDAIVEAAADSPDRRVLIDLAAQTQAPLTQWMDESQLLQVASEMDLRIRYWHVMDSGRDSVDLLRRLFDTYQGRLHYVLVKNEIRGNDFDILNKSGLLDRAHEFKAQVISIKKLAESAMTKIDAHSSSFWAAAQTDRKEAIGLGILERQRVRMWLNGAYQEIRKTDP